MERSPEVHGGRGDKDSPVTDLSDIARLFGGRRGATTADLARLEEYAGASLPDAYREFATLADGAEGWFGDEYVALWPSADVPEHNATLNVKRLAPGLLIIGTNGGGGRPTRLTSPSGAVSSACHSSDCHANWRSRLGTRSATGCPT